MGNAQTINLLPLHLLQNEDTLVFNRWYWVEVRVTWHPSFYTVIDSRVAKDTAAEIDAYVPTIREAAFIPVAYKFVSVHDKICSFQLLRMGFHTPPSVGGGGTVAHAALQILHYMGFKWIYIIGVDLTYSMPNSTVQDSKDGTDWTSKANDDINHFDPRYFGTNYQYHYPEVEETMKPSLRAANRYIRSKGGLVYDAGLGNVLKTLGIPKVQMSSLFTLSRLDRLRYLVKAITSKCDFLVRVNPVDNTTTLADVLKPSEPCMAGPSPERFRECVTENNKVIIVQQYDGILSDIARAVYDYKSFGPHDNQLVFCLRLDSITDS
eukprot:TRINITY_DN1774_c0_g3_i1.p1 TRINITY_DN1774_c0_g3~~TRINITY_DN1774_c0_g3_i1.p1  ORF type:complete len:322 (-),score=107.79 TRINITY_DN1774_c0_g3_i1:196-1161(-)